MTYSSSPTCSPSSKELAQVLFEVSCSKDFIVGFQCMSRKRAIHVTLELQVRWVRLFSILIRYIKFQDPIPYRSWPYAKRDAQTNRRTDIQTINPKAIYPSSYFAVGGINNSIIYLHRQSQLKFALMCICDA